MDKNAEYEKTFGAIPADFFENYIPCQKECFENFWIIFK